MLFLELFYDFLIPSSYGIFEIISFVMDTIPIKTVKELGCVLEADIEGRELAINRINEVNGSNN